MNNYSYYISPPYELYHHGIKGQKWGVRRYQNSDGSLTSAGKQRYAQGSGERKNVSIVKKVGGAVHRFRSNMATQRMADRVETRDRLDTMHALDAKYAKNDYDKARIDAQYRNDKIKLDYKDARDKAIIDKKYKKDPEYLQAKGARREQIAKNFIYGDKGAVRYDTLINMGNSKDQAEAILYVENLFNRYV